MSEKLNPVEIEDVLSSIRRLVSEDLRPTPRPLRLTGAKLTTAPEPLLLTPSLRIDGKPAEIAADVAQPQAEIPDVVEPPVPFIRSEERKMDAVIVDLAARLAQSANTNAQVPLSDPSGREAVEAVIFGLSAVARQNGGGDAPAADSGRIVDAEVVDDPVAAETFIETPAEAAIAEVPAADYVHVADADAEDVVDVPQAAEPPVVEPEQDHNNALPTFKSHRHAAELDAATDRAAPLGYELSHSVLDAIDEEIVAEIVRDVIREEFQGALGERITRNVRKLVRAEIHRALLAKGLN